MLPLTKVIFTMSNNPGNFFTKIQNEALINELKGNLFEYLVGSYLARFLGIEKEFISSFSGGIKRQLSGYELQLRQKDPQLLRQLPVLAQKTAHGLKSSLPKRADQLYVVGKIAGAGGNKEFHETDLLFVNKGKEVPIGLKLSKLSAFVNTKSGGVRSFLEKYFCKSKDVLSWQLKLNRELEKSYLQMACELHEMADLKFNGGFDYRWRESGFPELPGQLSKEMKKVVVQSYRPVIAVIHSALLNFYGENPLTFAESLLPLLGIGNRNVIQAICFYHNKSGNKGIGSRYNFGGLHIFDYLLMKKEMENLEIQELRESISSFEIQFSRSILQIRVKPMNKFTVPGFKINCSVKVF